MEFEYDPDKSRKNKQKHGLDFEEAQRIWDGPVLEFPARDSGEPRMLAIGVLDGKHWSAIITRRGATIRLISIRRSRNEEKEIYEERRD